MTCDALWVDEAAYVKPEIYTDVIMPLLAVGRTTLIVISTPSDSFSIFHKLLTAVNPVFDRLIFSTLVLELVCPRCKKSARSAACKHYAFKLPDWKKLHRQNEVQVLTDLIDPNSTLTESRGMLVDHAISAIPDSIIDAFEAKPLYDAWGADARVDSVLRLRETVGEGTAEHDPLIDGYYITESRCESTYSITAIDPNTTVSATSSDFAIVTLTIVHDTILVSIFALLLFFLVQSQQLAGRSVLDFLQLLIVARAPIAQRALRNKQCELIAVHRIDPFGDARRHRVIDPFAHQ